MHILADADLRGVEALFGGLGEVQRMDGRNVRPAQLRGIDALLVRSVTQVNEALLQEHTPRFIGTATAGVEHVDVDLLRRRGVVFASAPGANAEAVVDYALSAIVNCDDYLERLLGGESVGIIGYGRVGRRLGARLDALGISWIACDPWVEQVSLRSGGATPRLGSLQAVLGCLVMCVHASLTRAQPWPSAGLLGAAELASARRDALLVNAARGGLLRQGEVRGYIAQTQTKTKTRTPQLALDVWEDEPAIDCGLLSLCRFGTPHIAGYSLDAKLHATRMLRKVLGDSLGLPSSPEPCLEPHSELESEFLITVPPDLQGAALLRWLVNQCCDIREDDALLRAAPNDFDRLRREYRERRELGVARIGNGPDLSPEQHRLCRALGCRLD